MAEAMRAFVDRGRGLRAREDAPGAGAAGPGETGPGESAGTREAEGPAGRRGPRMTATMTGTGCVWAGPQLLVVVRGGWWLVLVSWAVEAVVGRLVVGV